MDIEEIRKFLPGIHLYLSTRITSLDIWAQVHSDLCDLFWLSDKVSPEKVIFSIISICDRIGKLFLTEGAYFNIFSLSRVILYINDTIYKVVTNKENIKEICVSSKNLINEMHFFKSCFSIIASSDPENLESNVAKIESHYKRLKEIFTDVTRQLEKSIQHEFDKGLGDVLDEVFFSIVLKPNKSILRTDELISLMRSYKKDRLYTGGYGYFPTNYKYDDIYIGQMQLGLKHGYGKMYYSYRDLYEGYWQDDKKHGSGIYTWKNGSKYCGEFKSGKFHGKGKKIYPNGSFYEGEYVKGKRSGKGFMKFKNGDTYQGEWEDDDMNGIGVYIWKSGDRFEGLFKRDKRDGKGTLTLNTGEIIEGIWVDGVQKKPET